MYVSMYINIDRIKRSNRPSSILIVGNFNAPLLMIDRKSKSKIYKKIKELYNTIKQLGLTDIYKH